MYGFIPFQDGYYDMQREDRIYVEDLRDKFCKCLIPARS